MDKVAHNKWKQQHIANAKLTRKKSQSFLFALSEIDRITRELELPESIKKATAVLYRRAIEKPHRGRSIRSIIAAALYITCRQYREPRTMREIVNVSRVQEEIHLTRYISGAALGRIHRTITFLIRELGLKIPPVSPIDFVPRFCSLLNLDINIQSIAIEIIERADKLTSKRGSIGIAATAIYIAAILGNKPRALIEIADTCGVTGAMIRSLYKELKELLDISIILNPPKYWSEIEYILEWKNPPPGAEDYLV